MELKELQEAYKVAKLAFDKAKKEEEKYKELLKSAMFEAGEKDITDADGFRFERVVQNRKSMDETALIGELHELGLEECISTKEVVNEEATLKAVESGKLSQDVLAKFLTVKEVVVLKMSAPKKGKKA